MSRENWCRQFAEIGNTSARNGYLHGTQGFGSTLLTQFRGGNTDREYFADIRQRKHRTEQYSQEPEPHGSITIKTLSNTNETFSKMFNQDKKY